MPTRRRNSARTSIPPRARNASSINSSPSRSKSCASPNASRQQHFWSKLDTSSLEKYQTSSKPFRNNSDEEVIGKLPDADAADESAHPANLRRAEVEGLRSDARPLSRCFRLRHSAVAEGPESRARSGRSSSASTASKAGRPTCVIPKRRRKYYNSFGAGWPTGATSSTRRRTRTSARTSSASSSARPTRLACRSSPSSSASTNARSTGWRRCRTSIPSASPSTACPTAARRPCACRPC